MTEQNKIMKEYLKDNGIDAMPKYIKTGSMAGLWRLYNTKTDWHDNKELWEKLERIGFLNFYGKPFTKYDGNGGEFHLFARFTMPKLIFA